MIFTSFRYYLFFPLVVVLFYLIPQRFRWVLLLMASMLFYAVFSWQYLAFLMVVILMNYLLGLQIITGDGRTRKRILASGIIINILILCFFKYFNWLGIDLIKLAGLLDFRYPTVVIHIVLPLGLSYFTFTAISYLIGIHRQEIRAEKHPGILSLFFLFFPKMAQGPIERPANLIPQFHTQREFRYEDFTLGFKLMAWGFFKKLVIADNLSALVNPIYSHPGKANGLITFIGIVFFAFQLYADFSGYTDIALGSAKVLGFDLMQNFRRPFLARSIRDFWTRWHISLSSWCSDYIFLPIVEHSYSLKRRLRKYRYLGRLSAEKIMYVLATFTTFIIIGIWHGTGWNYLIVGLLFGSYVSLDMVTKKFWKNFNSWTGITRYPLLFTNIQVITTFLLCCVIWVFFRVDSFPGAMAMFQSLFRGWSVREISGAFRNLSSYDIDLKQFILMVAGVGFLVYTDIISEKKTLFERISEKPVLIRWSIYYAVILVILLFGAFENRQFMYTQY